MILNLVFHGAWAFVISEKTQQIFAYAPDESSDHVYGVGSVTQGTLTPLKPKDYEFKGVIPYQDGVWYPNNEYSPLISAKKHGVRQMDPDGNRYCCIYLPYPQPVNIFPLEPYDTVSFLSGAATSDLANLKQFPSVHSFVYEFSSLQNLQFQSDDNEIIIPNLAPNSPPYQQTANLHVLATYIGEDDSAKEMEKCFTDITNLFNPSLDLKLTVKNDSPTALGYALPPGLTQDEVELPSENKGPFYGPAHNCQNTNFFVNETDGIQLP